MTSNEARVYFSLAGYYFNPADLTPLLGLEPSSAFGGGIPDAGGPVLGTWEFSTDKLKDDDINIFTMTNGLVDQLEPITDKILKAIEAYNLIPKIGVVLTISDDNDESKPEFGFDTKAIKFMAEIGAFVVID